MTAAKRYAVFNERRQPVELHYAQQVVVVPALGRIELAGDALQAPQIQYLLARRFISAQEIQEEARAEEPKQGQEQASAEEEPKQGGDEEEQKPAAGADAGKPAQKRRHK
jgi:hypothetical protein